MIGDFNLYKSREALAEALACRVEAWASRTQGAKRLELSGGSTPKQLLARLAVGQISADLTLMPVDDRCVPQDQELSNAGMFAKALPEACLTPLYQVDQGIGGSVERLRTDHPYGEAVTRFLILGMGPDGHTASLFPGSADLGAGLDPCAPAFIAAQPTLAPLVPRITMTAPYILAADQVVLHIHGLEKRDVFVAAKEASPHTYPIAHFLRHPAKTVHIYYAD